MNFGNKYLKNQSYYKYRSLENWEYILDILLNKKLHASEFEKLNDPMEGVFKYDSFMVDEAILREISEKKRRLRICSLSETPDNDLMWSYYGGGHKGICIEVKLRSAIKARQVDYSGIASLHPSHDDSFVYEILSRKERAWMHEREHRVITAAANIPIAIQRVILGSKMSSAHKKLLEKLLPQLGIEFCQKL